MSDWWATPNELALHDWLARLELGGSIVLDTSETDYAHAESAVGVLRKKAKLQGLSIRARVFDSVRAEVWMDREEPHE